MTRHSRRKSSGVRCALERFDDPRAILRINMLEEHSKKLGSVLRHEKA
jgi:hypothetical protein